MNQFLNTKYFHENCYRENIIPKCNYCLKSLESKYISFESRNYHKNCYENNILPKCDICNYPLEARYNIDSWGNQYHDKHKNNPGTCSSCSRIVDPIIFVKESESSAFFIELSWS